MSHAESVTKARADLLATLRERIRDNTRTLGHLDLCDFADGWIVRNSRGNVCIHYLRDGTPCHAQPERATRFESEFVARRQAERTFNGAGEPAKAIKLSQALREDTMECERLIASIENVEA